MSLYLRLVSSRQYIVGSCVLIFCFKWEILTINFEAIIDILRFKNVIILFVLGLFPLLHIPLFLSSWIHTVYLDSVTWISFKVLFCYIYMVLHSSQHCCFGILSEVLKLYLRLCNFMPYLTFKIFITLVACLP
jgi:hypothetical protein